MSQQHRRVYLLGERQTGLLSSMLLLPAIGGLTRLLSTIIFEQSFQPKVLNITFQMDIYRPL